ncbi:HEXA_B [Mytilus coruscus]|uniref:beta-N-acetylhexosaminidase n=1 Tax=Mytilus coruscus TaxID=42192 RepID=A0A6J8DAS9_MYTCO|nr:HEXA_B [Mytilus coruscus]
MSRVDSCLIFSHTTYFYYTSVSALDLDKLSKTLKVRYDVVRNGILMYGTVSYYANITLENAGTESIPRDGWSLFFCHDTLIQPVYFNASTNQYTGGGLILSGNVTLSHIKGCMFKFEPYNGENFLYHFLPLQPGERRNISFLASNWAVSKFDMFPNFYLANNTHTAILQNTKDNDLSYVSPLDDFPKFMRNIPNDAESVPLTPWERYKGYNFSSKEEVRHKVLPTPLRTETKQGSIKIDNTWTIDTNGRPILQGMADYLRSKKSPLTNMKIVNKKDNAPNVIQLSLNPGHTEGPEGYGLQITVKPARVFIVGSTLGGLHNGIQTFLSLMATGSTLPVMRVVDRPRFEYRGLQLDVARNFFNKSTVMKLLEVMAMYKLNKLQLNMADEEGWRIEVPGIPELTDIGGRRCHDVNETKCLFSQLGSDPSGNGTGSGYYTQKDYIDILRAAKFRNIEIIPSINMANRARAAIVAMNAYSKRTKNYDMALMDVTNAPLYLSDSLYSDNAINPCMPSTYRFLDRIIKTLKAYHKDAGHPLQLFNVGGDDSPRAAWLNSTYCVDLGIVDPDPWMRIKVNYTTNLATLARANGVNLGAYEEFFVAFPTLDPLGGPLTPFSRSRFPKEVEIYVTTRNTQTDTLLKRAFVFANNSYNVILSPSNFMALDHVSEPDPSLPGDYWATRYINISKIFGYAPDNFCCNFRPDKFNYVSTRTDEMENYGCLDDIYCDFPIGKTLVDRIYSNLKGMQTQVWTTKIRSEEHLFQLLMPRLIAFAERAWHKAPWESTYQPRINLRRGFPRPDLEAQEKDLVELLSIIGHKEFDRLADHGIQPFMPPPGARSYPAFTQQVISTQNKWQDIKPATDISNLKMTELKFRARNNDTTKFSKVTTLQVEEPKSLQQRLFDAGYWTPPQQIRDPRAG